jgi:hypothetical protein
MARPFNHDLKRVQFHEVVLEDEGKAARTMSRIQFQRLCLFYPGLSISAKAKRAGITTWEARQWWEVAFKGKDQP